MKSISYLLALFIFSTASFADALHSEFQYENLMINIEPFNFPSLRLHAEAQREAREQVRREVFSAAQAFYDAAKSLGEENQPQERRDQLQRTFEQTTRRFLLVLAPSFPPLAQRLRNHGKIKIEIGGTTNRPVFDFFSEEQQALTFIVRLELRIYTNEEGRVTQIEALVVDER